MWNFKWMIALALAASFPCQADNCEQIRSQIQTKIQASGVSNFILITTDAANSENGKIVGSCANGTKKIVYLVVNGSSTAKEPVFGMPNTPESVDNILTECKDGSVVIGPNCPLKEAEPNN